MTLNSINVHSVNFKQETEINKEKVSNSIKSDYERAPQKDSFVKDKNAAENIENDSEVLQKEVANNDLKNKSHLTRNIVVTVVALPILLYGGLVLKHKLSKPTFEEIQKCFKEIFSKDLSKEEVNSLLEKYKKLLKNDNTEDFAKQIIEELKKDYGIEKVKTKVNVELLKDGKIKTAIEHTKLGEASPLGDINILPRTNSQVIGRGNQKEIFGTGFHELKHMKQFADAYRTNPDKFVDAIYEHNVTKDVIDEAVKEIKTNLKKEAEKFLKDKDFAGMSLSDIEKLLNDEMLKQYKTYEDCVSVEIKKKYKQMLDERFGTLELYKEGSEEYKKGMEYIDAYAKYPDPDKNYDAYRNNLLEKEAWANGDLSEKVYNYLKSIWSI